MEQIKRSKTFFATSLVVQIFVVFIIAAISYTNDTGSEVNIKATPPPVTHDLVPADHSEILKLFLAPINVVGLIFAASRNFHLLILYFPIRWFCSYLLVECAKRHLLLYLPGILAEISVQICLAIFIYKIHRLGNACNANTNSNINEKENISQNSNLPNIVIETPIPPPPSYVEVTRNPENYPKF